MEIGEVDRAFNRIGSRRGAETEEPEGLVPSIGVRQLIVIVVRTRKAA